MLRVEPAAIPEVLYIEPEIFRDTRGFFYESFHEKAFLDATGTETKFI